MSAILAFFLSNPIGRALGAIGLVILAYFGFRAWLAAHDASIASEARAGYVLIAEKVTAEAKATEMERQRNASSQSLETYRQRQAADELALQQKDTDLENSILGYEVRLSQANRKCVVDRDDAAWLREH